MKQSKQSAAVANLIASQVTSDDERAAFDRQVAKLVAQADLLTALEAEREAQGLTKQELADRIGVRRSVVSRLLSGKIVNPQLGTLADMAYALGIYFDIRIKRQPKAGGHAPIEVHSPA